MVKYELGAMVEPLCLWFEENERSMPWREEPTPYHVWISEIMLQQTRIEAAKSYYERFTKRLPDVGSLASVSEEELLKLWEGLGYYNRARNLQKAAKFLVDKYEGQLPAEYDLLLELPGIGSYTAGAIASIAYGRCAPAVDGNVLRVTMRYLNCQDDISKQSVRREMEHSIMEVIPKEKPGTFNQALMELGEVICIPNGMPLCDRCPIADTCVGKKCGTQLQLPVKPAKKERRIEKRTILIIEKEGQIALHQRPKQGLLAGLWEFPSLDGYYTKAKLQECLSEQGILDVKIEKMKDGKHIFSHMEWHMRGYYVQMEEKTQDMVPNLVWVSREKLEKNYAIPVAFHSFLHQLLSQK